MQLVGVPGVTHPPVSASRSPPAADNAHGVVPPPVAAGFAAVDPTHVALYWEAVVRNVQHSLRATPAAAFSEAVESSVPVKYVGAADIAAFLLCAGAPGLDKVPISTITSVMQFVQQVHHDANKDPNVPRGVGRQRKVWGPLCPAGLRTYRWRRPPLPQDGGEEAKYNATWKALAMGSVRGTVEQTRTARRVALVVAFAEDPFWRAVVRAALHSPHQVPEVPPAPARPAGSTGATPISSTPGDESTGVSPADVPCGV